jgi:hypothetical protein
MGARRRWGTAVVVALVVAFGVGGATYLCKQAGTDSDDAQDDDFVVDASADARAGGKKKPGKKGARGGKPRGGGGGGKPRPGGGHSRGGAGGSGGGADPGAGTDDDTGDDPVPVAVRPPFTGRGPAGPTYEAAIASNKQEIVIGSQGAPDLSDAQLSGPMRNGAFVGECGAPDGMKVTVKVAVKMGRPVGVSVYTSPSDPDVAGCIDRYVRTFSWPSNAKMDSFATTY